MKRPLNKNTKFHLIYLGIIIVLGFMFVSSLQIANKPHTTNEAISDIPYSDEEVPDEIYVHIKGEVKNPGLYKIEYGLRVFEAIEQAGGFTENADPNSVHLSKYLEDGDMVNVKPKKQEKTTKATNTYKSININSASKSDFASLPGISNSLASDIVEFRNYFGGFKSTEDLMKIKGFSSNLYLELKPYLNL